jgi:hypothetical protein
MNTVAPPTWAEHSWKPRSEYSIVRSSAGSRRPNPWCAEFKRESAIGRFKREFWMVGQAVEVTSRHPEVLRSAPADLLHPLSSLQTCLVSASPGPFETRSRRRRRDAYQQHEWPDSHLSRSVLPAVDGRARMCISVNWQTTRVLEGM